MSDRRTRFLVLSGETLLAGKSGVHLSALERQSGGLVAIPVSGDGPAAACRVLAVAAAGARSPGGTALLRGNAVSGAGTSVRRSGGNTCFRRRPCCCLQGRRRKQV